MIVDVHHHLIPTFPDDAALNAHAEFYYNALHGRPLPRLYAAGQTTGGRLGLFYPGGGSALADCLVFGRIAGKNAAAESPVE